ncbi:MAG: Ig-like domain-containing protein [Myxococcales bacterium]|jgi:hypothetical protein
MKALRSLFLTLTLAAAAAACGRADSTVDEPAVDENKQGATDWGCYSPKPGHPTVAEKDTFVSAIAVFAKDAERTYGPPAAALIAMACNESGFGWTRIGLEANNLYGWKWYSSSSADGRDSWTLTCQPAWDPNNKYVVFEDYRDSVLFVASKLATLSWYKPVTERYKQDVANGVEIRTAVNRWVAGIQQAGYNPYITYVQKTESFLNNYRAPSATYSPEFNLYRYSPAGSGGGEVWISIDSPSNGATVSGDVAFKASVGGGTVTEVKFFSRAKDAAGWYGLGSDTSAPYEKTWSTSPWLTNGTYELMAEAWNGSTKRATGIIEVQVRNEEIDPISIVSPTSGAQVSGPVSIATEVAESVDSVTFYSRRAGAADWYQLGTDSSAPFSWQWQTDPWVPNGAYELRAVAFAGTAELGEDVVEVQVANVAPVTIDSPANGAQVAGAVTISASAHESADRVAFYSRAAGATDWYQLGIDSSAPFSWQWHTDPWVPNGTYELRAVAFAGTAELGEDVVEVQVLNALVTIDSPADGAQVAGTVTIAASAHESVDSVAFFSRAVGATNWYQLGIDSSGPFSWQWYTDPWVPNGTYELRAVAYTGAQAVGEDMVTVSVGN